MVPPGPEVTRPTTVLGVHQPPPSTAVLNKHERTVKLGTGIVILAAIATSTHQIREMTGRR